MSFLHYYLNIFVSFVIQLIDNTNMVRKEDFFISSNSVHSISEEEYQKVELLIKIFDAISRTTSQSLYIIDYYKKDFLHVSGNPLFLCGHTSEQVKQLGYMFYINHVPPPELDMLTKINKAGFNFFHTIPTEERTEYTISYDFHIVNSKKQMLINHKLTPLILTSDGRMWLAACVVSLSPHDTPGHVELRKSGMTQYWEYSLESHRWVVNNGITLNEREKDILLLSAKGYTMYEIADKLCIAIDTVKFYKRKLFEKLEVKNITEALSFATNYKLL